MPRIAAVVDIHCLDELDFTRRRRVVPRRLAQQAQRFRPIGRAPCAIGDQGKVDHPPPAVAQGTRAAEKLARETQVAGDPVPLEIP